MALDEPQNFVALGHRRGRQILEQVKDRCAVVQACAGDPTHHERMHEDDRSFQQVDKPWIAMPTVIDPHGRVVQNQTGRPWRLRGAAFASSSSSILIVVRLRAPSGNGIKSCII